MDDGRDLVIQAQHVTIMELQERITKLERRLELECAESDRQRRIVSVLAERDRYDLALRGLS